MKRQLVAGPALGLCRGARRLLHVVGHAGEFVFADEVRKAVGGIEHVLGELLCEFGLLFLQLLEAVFRRALQLGARQHEVADCIRQRAAPRRAQARGSGRRGDLLVLRVQPLVGRMARRQLGDLGQRRVVGGAQRRRVGDCVEVAHRAPGELEALAGDVEHGRHRVVVGCDLGSDRALQRRVGGSQQLVDRRLDMLGANLVVSG